MKNFCVGRNLPHPKVVYANGTLEPFHGHILVKLGHRDVDVSEPDENHIAGGQSLAPGFVAALHVPFSLHHQFVGV